MSCAILSRRDEMPGLVELIGELLATLKPLVAPSEYDRLVKIFWKIKEENDEAWKRIKAALAAGDISALNAILAELLEL
jgi:hypothetical protein